MRKSLRANSSAISRKGPQALYSLEEAAQVLGLSESVLLRLTQFFKIPHSAYDSNQYISFTGDIQLSQQDLHFYREVRQRILAGENLIEIKTELLPENKPFEPVPAPQPMQAPKFTLGSPPLVSNSSGVSVGTQRYAQGHRTSTVPQKPLKSLLETLQEHNLPGASPVDTAPMLRQKETIAPVQNPKMQKVSVPRVADSHHPQDNRDSDGRYPNEDTLSHADQVAWEVAQRNLSPIQPLANSPHPSPSPLPPIPAQYLPVRNVSSPRVSQNIPPEPMEGSMGGGGNRVGGQEPSLDAPLETVYVDANATLGRVAEKTFDAYKVQKQRSRGFFKNLMTQVEESEEAYERQQVEATTSEPFPIYASQPFPSAPTQGKRNGGGVSQGGISWTERIQNWVPTSAPKSNPKHPQKSQPPGPPKLSQKQSQVQYVVHPAIRHTARHLRDANLSQDLYHEDDLYGEPFSVGGVPMGGGGFRPAYGRSSGHNNPYGSPF